MARPSAFGWPGLIRAFFLLALCVDFQTRRQKRPPGLHPGPLSEQGPLVRGGAEAGEPV